MLYFFSLGEVGCSVDALPYLDKACSDRPTCEYYVANRELAETQPCLSNNKPYLELDFICIEGKYQVGVFCQCFMYNMLGVQFG